MTDGPSRPRVFVSAVSSELRAARQLVANCLRVFHDVDVVFQEELGMEAGKLLAVLRQKIDESAGVLQLVGEAYGAAPPGKVPGFGPVSFTQYEFLYALKQNAPQTERPQKERPQEEHPRTQKAHLAHSGGGVLHPSDQRRRVRSPRGI